MTHFVIGTAGHIDHGKSTLVRALTGIDPDRLKEEKARGITIDLGFAHAQLDALRIAFVDVPGHEKFVRNMLAGATGIDAVLLVVAADESVMPQTREHFAICRLLGVRAGLVALTKVDAADPDLLEIARMDVRELVAGSFLDGAPIVDVSARTGQGLDALQRALASMAPRAQRRDPGGPVRLPIDRAFTMKGFGAVVTGTLQSGVLRVEDELELLSLPAGREGRVRGRAGAGAGAAVDAAARRVRVRGLQVHGAQVREAEAGERVAVNLSDVDASALARGDTLIAPAAFVSSRRLDVTVELLPDARPLVHGARVRVHHGTRDVIGRVAIAEVTRGEATKPAAVTASPVIPPGGRARARLRLEAPLVATRGDRFVLRAYSPVVTIGGGGVLDPQPTRAALRTPAALARFAALDPDMPTAERATDGRVAHEPQVGSATSPLVPLPASNKGARGAGGVWGMPFRGDELRGADERAALVLLGEAAHAGLPIAALGTRLGLRGAAIDAMVDRLVAAARAVRVGDLIVSKTVGDRLAEALIDLVRRHHRAQPDSDGLPREEARDRLGLKPGVFDALVARLAEQGALAGRDRLALATHRAAVPDADAAALARIEDVLRDAHLKPPDVGELAAQVGLAPPALDRLINFLVRHKRLVKLGTLVFHQDALTRLKDDTRALKAAAPDSRATVDVASFKTRYDMSRKYAIPLLEYLDRERVTRRAGDVRTVL